MEWFIIFVLAVAVIWFGAWKISDAYDKSVARQVRLESDLRRKGAMISDVLHSAVALDKICNSMDGRLQVLEQLAGVEFDYDIKTGGYTIRSKTGQFEVVHDGETGVYTTRDLASELAENPLIDPRVILGERPNLSGWGQ